MNKTLPDIVIPHHNRYDLIGGCLQQLPMSYKVFIVRGFNFAEACNKGSFLSEAERIIFLNDDVVLTKAALNEIEQHDEDIVGLPLCIPSLNKTVYGMNMYWGKFGNINSFIDSVKTSLGFNASDKCQVPATGAAFVIKRKVFQKLGGFHEGYKNGGEDNELFMKAMERGYSFGFIKTICNHYHSSSSGRYDNDLANHKLLTERFPEKRLTKILGKSSTKDVLISVIIPTRLDEGIEPDCVKYIREQTHKRIEIIIVRDKELKGASWARNQGLKKATGEYLFFCDDDIELKPMMLEVFLSKLRYSDSSLIYCNYDRIGQLSGKVSGLPWNVEKLKATNYISTMSLVRASDFPKEGWDESLKRFQDWDIWLTMAEQGKTGIHINETLFLARYKPGDISSNKTNIEECLQAVRIKHKEFYLSKHKTMTVESGSIIKKAVPERQRQQEGSVAESAPNGEVRSPSSEKEFKLEIGGKSPVFLKGDWVHFDLQKFPHTEFTSESFSSLPFEEKTVDEVFSKRTLQKLDKANALSALTEWFRVLKDHGKITLIVVDTKKAMGKYLQTHEEKCLDLIYGSQNDSTEQYLTGYTVEIIKDLLTKAGFSNVTIGQPQKEYFDSLIEIFVTAEKIKK